MKHRTTLRNALAVSLSLGTVMLASQAMAAEDPPKNTHAATHESEEPVTDTWITTKVKSDLLASDGVPGTDISVNTVNGTVTLGGTVKSKAEHDKAIAVTKGIKGVKHVDATALKIGGMAKSH